MNNQQFEGLTCFTEELEVASFSLKEFNILILESDFLPGYYSRGNFPVNKKNHQKHHFYLPVKKSVNCFQDIVFRTTAKIKKEKNTELHVSPGQMTFQNKDYQCIKIQGNETEQMKPLLIELQKAGIEFFPRKNVAPYQSIIYSKRYIRFIQLFEGVYQDMDCEGRYFIKLQHIPDFHLFKEMISDIKNSCKFHLFDSFLSSFVTHDGAIDFAGIYSEHCDKSRLNEFKAEMEKEMLIIQ